MTAPALVLLGYGSHDPRVAQISADLRAALLEIRPALDVEVAFLDHCAPSAPQVVGQLVRRGVTEVVLVPLLLSDAFHAQVAVPAVVVNAQQDLIASNHMGRALFSPHFEADRSNLARFVFLDPRAHDFYVDWALARSMTAAMLRLEAGRDPLDSDLTALIGELSTLSPQFRQDWADRDVHEHRTGRKVYRHPEVGEMDITFDVFELPGEPGLSISTFSVEEGSESADKIALLATWAATRQFAGRPTDPAHGGERPDSQLPVPTND